MRIVHLIRRVDEEFGWDLLRHQAATDEVTVVLLHQAVPVTPRADLPTFALVEDPGGWRECPGVQPIDAPGLVRLLEGHDRAIVW